MGLAKEYPETDRGGGACMRAQSTVLSGRAVAGTRGTRRQLGSIGHQAHDALFKDCKWSTCDAS